LEKEKGLWLYHLLDKISIQNEKALTFSQIKATFESQFEDFELFWHSKSLRLLQQKELLTL
jgi:hypothetical protein